MTQVVDIRRVLIECENVCVVNAQLSNRSSVKATRFVEAQGMKVITEKTSDNSKGQMPGTSFDQAMKGLVLKFSKVVGTVSAKKNTTAIIWH